MLLLITACLKVYIYMLRNWGFSFVSLYPFTVDMVEGEFSLYVHDVDAGHSLFY